jgi:hypothetical protein
MSQIFFLYKFKVINIDSKYIYVKIFSLTGYLDVSLNTKFSLQQMYITLIQKLPYISVSLWELVNLNKSQKNT